MDDHKPVRVTRRQWLGVMSLLTASCGRNSSRPTTLDAGNADAEAPDAALGSDGATATDAGMPPIAALDDTMGAHMTALGIPGGTLAVMRDHRLVYAKGYGMSDVEAGTPAAADTLFRIASLSKQFTSAAIFRLVERGALDVNTRMADLVDVTAFLPPGATGDARIRDITVLQVLQHLGGWDRSVSPDPMFQSRVIASALGVASPPGPRDIARYQLGRPLDFSPGSRYAYSNFGYCLLGRVIEHLTGGTYEAFVRDQVLTPAGITRMRQGATLLPGRAPGEARYYTEGSALAESVFDTAPGTVPWPYGGYDLEAMDSHGAWVASAVDLMRLAMAMDPTGPSPLLRASSLAQMYALPAAPAWRNPDGSPMAAYYGCGWLVRPVASGGANYWHDGSLPGSFSYFVRLADGFCWATLFNKRSDSMSDANGAIDGQMNAAIASVRSWPTGDLFSRFG